MTIDAESIERIVPDHLRGGDVTGEETLRLHTQRYEFAAAHLPRGRVLDVACGVGYGAEILAGAARGSADFSYLGLDLAQEAIDYAQSHYACSGATYFRADALSFEDPGGFDAVVSLETVEHLPDPQAFLACVARWLRPGGVWIGSVPTTPTTDVIPFHLHDFTPASFRELVARSGLVEEDALLQHQRFHPLRLLLRREARARDLRGNLLGYYRKHPGKLVARVVSTLRYGFENRYLTLACRKPVARGAA